MATRENATPVQLAEEIAKVIGETDDNTACHALSIARLILSHRAAAQKDFERKCTTEAFEKWWMQEAR